MIVTALPDNMQLHELILTQILICYARTLRLKDSYAPVSAEFSQGLFPLQVTFAAKFKKILVCYMKRLSYDNNN